MFNNTQTSCLLLALGNEDCEWRRERWQKERESLLAIRAVMGSCRSQNDDERQYQNYPCSYISPLLFIHSSLPPSDHPSLLFSFKSLMLHILAPFDPWSHLRGLFLSFDYHITIFKPFWLVVLNKRSIRYITFKLAKNPSTVTWVVTFMHSWSWHPNHDNFCSF